MKFSIRDVHSLTVAAALALGWWLDHRKLVAEARLWEYRARTVTDYVGVSLDWKIDWTADGARITKPGERAQDIVGRTIDR